MPWSCQLLKDLQCALHFTLFISSHNCFRSLCNLPWVSLTWLYISSCCSFSDGNVWWIGRKSSTHSWSPEDNSLWLWWHPDISFRTTMELTFFFFKVKWLKNYLLWMLVFMFPSGRMDVTLVIANLFIINHNFCVLPFINHIGNVLRLSHHPEVTVRLLDITLQSTIAMNLFPLHFFSNVSASC